MTRDTVTQEALFLILFSTIGTVMGVIAIYMGISFELQRQKEVQESQNAKEEVRLAHPMTWRTKPDPALFLNKKIAP
jgi:hypothetical protein